MSPPDISAPIQSEALSGDLDGAALHVRPEVHAGVAADGDAASRHAAADPLDLSRVAANLELVARLAFDGEEVVEPGLPLSQVDGQGPDLVVRQSGASGPGDSISASSGTGGCSLRVSVIMRPSSVRDA